MGKNKTGSEDCLVCGDRAYGKHYGVYSCDGCSCFFKRTVRKRLSYSCTIGLQQCIVTRSKRNRCAFCRFKKCLEAKMNAKAVQKERGPRKKSTILSALPPVLPESKYSSKPRTKRENICSQPPLNLFTVYYFTESKNLCQTWSLSDFLDRLYLNFEGLFDEVIKIICP